MPDWKVDQMSPGSLTDPEILGDVLTHMGQIIDDCELKKITKRRAVFQAAYAVAKHFGHRSAHYDLYLEHASRAPHVLAKTEAVIKVPGTRQAHLYWDVTILGGETKKKQASPYVETRLQANAIMANQVEVQVYGGPGIPHIFVSIEVSGPALLNLCGDLGKRVLQRRIADMLTAKWGSYGTAYGSYRPHGQATGDDGYRYVHYIDGIPKVYTEGFQWVSGTINPEDMRL